MDLIRNHIDAIYISATVIVILIAVFICFLAISKLKKSSGKVNEKTTETYLSASNGGGAALTSEAITILIRNASNPDECWSVKLDEEVLIGRDYSCKIYLSDSAVSRKQCKMIDQVGPVIINLSSSNITQVNGKKITNAEPIKEGDRIKCGRVTLIVESITPKRTGKFESINGVTSFVRV